MNNLSALIAGLIQGLTEFLPVSSSGHLEIVHALCGSQTTSNLLFNVIVHGATLLSTILILYKPIYNILTDLVQFKWNVGTKYATLLVLSAVPAGIIGLLLEEKLSSLFTGNLLLVGILLIINACILTLASLAPKSTGGNLTYKSALLIGIAQAIAILPGISRSGSTLTTGLWLKKDRSEIATFIFLMSIIPILGANVLEIYKYTQQLEVIQPTVSYASLAIGFIAAFITGLIACKWMINLIKKQKLSYFAYYCAAIGTVAIIAHYCLAH